ncbi:Uncharacterised protein [Mycobacteroides abscessus subsp. abscessus]|nr:Uncharacterised protein [Mycobacteroides abscessus subsp. abscessus]
MYRSPATPSRPYQPERLTRKPVITSSMINRAPWFSVSSRRPALKPGSGATAPMLPAAASVMTQAISPGLASKAAATASRSL